MRLMLRARLPHRRMPEPRPASPQPFEHRDPVVHRDVDVVAELGAEAGARDHDRRPAHLGLGHAEVGDAFQVGGAHRTQDLARARALDAGHVNSIDVALDLDLPPDGVAVDPLLARSGAAHPPELLGVETDENGVLHDSAVVVAHYGEGATPVPEPAQIARHQLLHERRRLRAPGSQSAPLR